MCINNASSGWGVETGRSLKLGSGGGAAILASQWALSSVRDHASKAVREDTWHRPLASRLHICTPAPTECLLPQILHSVSTSPQTRKNCNMPRERARVPKGNAIKGRTFDLRVVGRIVFIWSEPVTVMLIMKEYYHWNEVMPVLWWVWVRCILKVHCDCVLRLCIDRK